MSGNSSSIESSVAKSATSPLDFLKVEFELPRDVQRLVGIVTQQADVFVMGPPLTNRMRIITLKPPSPPIQADAKTEADDRMQSYHTRVIDAPLSPWLTQWQSTGLRLARKFSLGGSLKP